MLRNAGIAAVNFDLMYGLPHQTVESVARNAEIAASLDPDRLSVFGYAHVPWMKSHMRMIDAETLPDMEARFLQAATSSDTLIGSNYRHIGLDHFARPGDPLAAALDNGTLRRNFQGYTTDGAETLIGFGASAIGAFRQGYVQNETPTGKYSSAIEAGVLATARGVEITAEDRARRRIIEQLMCYLSVDLPEVAPGIAMPSDALRPLEADGLVEFDERHVRITERGRPLMRAVCATFDHYLNPATDGHSSVV